MDNQIKLEVEVRFWLDRLKHSTTAPEKADAASELAQLPVRTRGSLRTRGTLAKAASSEFPSTTGAAMDIVLRDLRHSNPEVRRQVVYAVGEWGDEFAARIIAALLIGSEKDTDESSRRAAVSALGNIGGPEAVRALRIAAESDNSEAVRYDAISMLATLALQAYPQPSARARGAVRTRRAAVPREGLSQGAREILTTLISIRDNAKEKEYLRKFAEKTAAALQE